MDSVQVLMNLQLSHRGVILSVAKNPCDFHVPLLRIVSHTSFAL